MPFLRLTVYTEDAGYYSDALQGAAKKLPST